MKGGRGGKEGEEYSLIRIELLPYNLKESQNIASEDIIALWKDEHFIVVLK